MHNRIEPQKIMKALLYLKEHHPAYKAVTVNYKWESECAESPLWQVLTSSTVEGEEKENRDNTEQSTMTADQEIADRNAEIILQPFTSCLEIDDVEGATVCVAAAEGEKPKPMIMDEDFEVLAFPDLSPTGKGGFHPIEDRTRKLNLCHYYNQRLLNFDGLFSKNVEYLLTAQYSTELKQVQGNIGICLRLKKGQ